MNILILSAGTRNKIVQYFKKSLDGKGSIIATDCSNVAPAIYEADRHYIVSRMDAPGYIEEIYDICKKESISGVLSLIDPELSLIADHEESFKELGVTVIGSSYNLCEMSLDKYRMYEWLTNHGYKSAKSYIEPKGFYKERNAGNIDYPVFVKPVRGSASISISKAYDKETIETLYHHDKNLMIQELMDGEEIGADVYIDLISKEPVSIFTKKKIKMRAGETDKAVSFKDERLFGLIEEFVKKAGFIGQIDIDIFEIAGEYYISEINPRFGGGYPHAYEAGCDHMSLIINNLNGVTNTKKIGNYEEGIIMMKYNEIMIRKMH